MTSFGNKKFAEGEKSGSRNAKIDYFSSKKFGFGEKFENFSINLPKFCQFC